MKTIMLTLPDEDFEQLATEARTHGRSVEDEARAKVLIFEHTSRGLISDRNELARELDAFQDELAARGVYLSGAEISAGIKEGRE